MSWRGSATLYGPPATKGSARGFVNRKTGRVVISNDNPRGKSWQTDLALAMRETAPQMPLREPVGVRIGLYLRRPANHYGTGVNRYRLKSTAPERPTTKPDWDKAARCACDAMTGVWVADDSYIVEATVEKRYAEDGQERTEVEAWEVTG